ncbi:MAG TPA: hypothetical protein VER98_18980 [Terriglobia bacterium]|nr:hypothetical protein [Terriglobia bacterium]
MSERPTVSIPAEIEEARQQFENWRGERKRGERIPANLWATAVELAKQHGVWPTAKALHLDHSGLKRRVRNDEGDEKSSAFVELIPQGGMLYSCAVEMEDGRGARMRVELKGAAVDVTALSRTFWSERG